MTDRSGAYYHTRNGLIYVNVSSLEDGADFDRGGNWIQRIIERNEYRAARAAGEEPRSYAQICAEVDADAEARGIKKICFVATAAFENANHPTVATLRAWRDHSLEATAIGRKLSAAYWRIGPYLARGVEKFPRARPYLQRALTYLANKIA
jgi:hypothetical protein